MYRCGCCSLCKQKHRVHSTIAFGLFSVSSSSSSTCVFGGCLYLGSFHIRLSIQSESVSLSAQRIQRHTDVGIGRCWCWTDVSVCVHLTIEWMNKCELLEKYVLKLKLNKTNGMNHCDPTANEERKCANCHMFLVLLAEISTHTHPTNEQSEWIRSRNLLCYYCCSWTFQCTCRHRLLLLLLLLLFF